MVNEKILQVWYDDLQKTRKQIIQTGEEVISLRKEQEALTKKISQISSQLVLKKIEQQIEDIENKILATTENRNDEELKEAEIEAMLNYINYFLEHLESLFINRENPWEQKQLFELLFSELPTYEEIKFGTPKLRLILVIFGGSESTEISLVDRLVLNWNTVLNDLRHITSFLKGLCEKYPKSFSDLPHC